MRQMIRSLVLTAAVATVSIPSLYPALCRADDTPAAPAAQPADAKAVMPVKRVVLYSSGVGYFQHAGIVDGDATTELRFKSEQINDVLKSLVLEDTTGTVSAVTYPSQDPLAKILRSFQVDITSNPSLDQLLNQLRGAKVTLTLSTENITGTILGVEQRTKPAGDNKTYTVPVINIISGANIRSVELPDVRDIQLDNPELQDELAKALAALASARDQDKKPVTIHFKGTGQRQAMLGYVVETPVWKTSYRLIIDNDAAKLQGWAIVENQTDNDWKDVELSLVSGRPISFIEDLYQPLYIPRPIVQPELFASLKPQMYDAADKNMVDDQKNERAAFGPRSQMMKMATAAQASPSPINGPAMTDQLMDVTRSISSIASAASLGELFEYTVPSVSLPRQSSAMIPIITDPIQCEKLSIFNQEVLARHPLNGARIKNTTGKHLLSGPITVLDGSTYAGDAQINDVPPGQERLISYGIDLQMLVDIKSNNTTDELLTGKITRGILEMSHKYIRTVEYDIDNKSDHDKTLIIEHPIQQGWNLIDTQNPIEKTDRLYRFEDKVKAGQQDKLTVKEQLVQDQGFAILNTDIDALVEFSHHGQIPKEVIDALLKAVDLKRAVADTDQKINQANTREADIVQDQKRINETLKTIGQNTALYTRLLKKLDDQETDLEKIRSDRDGPDGLIKQKADQQKQLEDYIASLNVG